MQQSVIHPNIDSDPRFIALSLEAAQAHRFPRRFSTLRVGLSPSTFDSEGRLVYNHT